MVRRKSIEVDLDCEQALTRVAASFERAKTSPSRTWDHGWIVERDAGRLLIYPRHPGDHLLDPLPDTYFPGPFPETLAIEIEAVARAGGGTRVTAKVVHRRVLAFVGAVAVDIVASLLVPFVQPIVHGIERAALRANRRGAKVRMVRLALEPLLPYERQPDRGPFRG